MSNEELFKTLESNMKCYRQLDEKYKELETHMKMLRNQNLQILHQLDIKTYKLGDLQIRIQQNHKKIGVDENILTSLIGKERVDALKIIPVDKVVAGIKEKTIPESAESAIIKIDQPEFTVITQLKKHPEVSL